MTLLNAFNGFYASYDLFPWQQSGSQCAAVAGTPVHTIYMDSSRTPLYTYPCIQTLIDAGELNKSFRDKSALPRLWVTDRSKLVAGDNFITVCFDPESKLTSQNPETAYNNQGDKNACNPATSTICWACIR